MADLPKSGHAVCIFQKDSFKVMEDQIHLSLGRNFVKLGTRYLYFRLPPHIRDKRIKKVRIVPRYYGRYFEIAYVYTVEPETPVSWAHHFRRHGYTTVGIGKITLRFGH